jgi:polar amino acid transport system substrate-binding protein
MRKLFLSLASALLVFSSVHAKTPKLVKVGTNSTYPPFEFVNEKGEIVGFDIDLIRLLLTKSGYEVEFVDMDFDGLIPALTTGKIDVIASGMAATTERRKVINFSDEYHNDPEDGSGIYVLESNTTIKNAKDLEGKTIGAEMGTIQAEYAHTIKNAKVIDVAGSEVYMMVSAKKVDAAILLLEGAKNYSDKNKNANNRIKKVGETVLVSGTYFGLRKDANDLRKDINKQLSVVKKNGEYQALVNKWLSK